MLYVVDFSIFLTEKKEKKKESFKYLGYILKLDSKSCNLFC